MQYMSLKFFCVPCMILRFWTWLHGRIIPHRLLPSLFQKCMSTRMEAYNWTGSYNNEQERRCVNVHSCVWILHVSTQQAISHTCAPPSRAPFYLPFTAAHSLPRRTTLPKFASLPPNHGDERIQQNFWKSAAQKKSEIFGNSQACSGTESRKISQLSWRQEQQKLWTAVQQQ